MRLCNGPVFERVFDDLISVFDTYHGDDSLPDMFCEACDLLALPSLELDPVSKQREANTKVFQSLCISVESLPSKIVYPLTDQALLQLQFLKDLVDTVQKFKDQLSCTLDVSIKELKNSTSLHIESAQKFKDQLFSTLLSSMKKLKDSNIKNGAVPPWPTNSSVHVEARDFRNNVIIFGLEEKLLLETRKDVDNILGGFVWSCCAI